eukprot:3191736-Rhodomonas_salina.1
MAGRNAASEALRCWREGARRMVSATEGCSGRNDGCATACPVTLTCPMLIVTCVGRGRDSCDTWRARAAKG